MCVRVGQLALTELGSLLASNGAAGCPALLSASPRGGFVAARERTALWNLLSKSLSVFPNHREMYAPQFGNRAGRLPSDDHSVSSLSSIKSNGNQTFFFLFTLAHCPAVHGMPGTVLMWENKVCILSGF